MATSGTRALPSRRALRARHSRTPDSKQYPTILAPYLWPDSISALRSSTVGLVLSTTTGNSARNAASTSSLCLLLRFLLLRKRSLLTCSWVAANRSRKNVLFPEACRPTRMTNSTFIATYMVACKMSVISLVCAWQKKPRPDLLTVPLRGRTTHPAMSYRDGLRVGRHHRTQLSGCRRMAADPAG